MPERSLKKLKKHGISDWGGLLFYLPSGYKNFKDLKSLRELQVRSDIVSSAMSVVLSIKTPPYIIETPVRRICFDALDTYGTSVKISAILSLSPNPRSLRRLSPGDQILITGKLQNWGGKLQIVNPEFEIQEDEGKIIPCYPLKSLKLDQAEFRLLIRHAVDRYLPATTNQILSLHNREEADLLKKFEIASPSIQEVIRKTHTPQNIDEALVALSDMRKLLKPKDFNLPEQDKGNVHGPSKEE